MGSSPSSCPQRMKNPDAVNVVTLSDSAVQRLPLLVDTDPLSVEKRNQNIDDFWREQLECVDRAHSVSKGATEEEFSRLESMIKGTSGKKGVYLCEKSLHDVEMCYMKNPTDPLRCNDYAKTLQLCLDTVLAEASMKEHMEDVRKAKTRRSRC